MKPITPRQEARSTPRVSADALPPAEHRVPPAGAHHRRNLMLGLAGLGLLTLLLVALVARTRDRDDARDTTIVFAMDQDTLNVWQVSTPAAKLLRLCDGTRPRPP